MAEDKYPPDPDKAEDALITASATAARAASSSDTTRSGCPQTAAHSPQAA